MKITETGAGDGRRTTLNDIPVGQVFRGTLETAQCGKFTGLFHKVSGPCPVFRTLKLDCVVVLLQGDAHGYAPLFSICCPVTHYEPLNAELVIKGAL